MKTRMERDAKRRRMFANQEEKRRQCMIWISYQRKVPLQESETDAH
jgi:hypothetical protein